MTECPLCLGFADVFYSQQDVNWKLYPTQGTELKFFGCPKCDLVFKDRRFALSLERQKQRYLAHENSFSEGYASFLDRLWAPLSAHLRPGDKGLDFGCGPTKVLEEIARSKNYTCDSYDLIFFSDQNLLDKKYDFIFCSEVVEHFVTPREDWALLKKLLNPGAHLGVMTSFLPKDFESWYYHRDPTHVSFYTPRTIQWLAGAYGLEVTLCHEGVCVLRSL